MRSIKSLGKFSTVALLLLVAVTSDLQGVDAAARRLKKGGCAVRPDTTEPPSSTLTPAPVPVPVPSPTADDGDVDKNDNGDDEVPPSTTAPEPEATTAAPADGDDVDEDENSDTTDEDTTGSDNDEATTPAPVAPSTPTTKTPVSPAAPAATPTTTKPAAPVSPPANNGTLCATPTITVSEIDVGVSVVANEDEAALKLLAISAKPSGGAYVAFHSTTKGTAYVVELDANDKLVAGSRVEIAVHDFSDIYADDKGFVVLATRDAQGGGTLNCGNPANLCGAAPSPPVSCFDMYLIRFDGGKESWATKLTSSSATLPPYSSSKTGPDVFMIWWYAHHGRIAFDGTNWASYFGAAISTSEGGCINIHQGDRMQIVGPTGALVKSANAFDWGCSHSGYERVLYDDRSKEFTGICKTDNNNRIKFPTSDATVYPVDLGASNLGDIVKDGSGSGSGYWMTVSNGQGNNAKVHLMHFTKNKATDKDIVLGGAQVNERACHLAAIGQRGLLAVWEGSSTGGDLTENGSRQMYVQVRSATDGAQVSDVVTVNDVKGNRYQAFREFPDGSVAYVAKGSAATKLKLLRVMAC